ncbi:aromatic-ring hydroxylase C-terminal domain-containing protein [Kribbella sp. CA-293567]|uniref:aromatic-ring hydroxylase C-terminal domain-containing protein n=1 Tax=Kribbella sp. CA-293567 TaxID=3002436 RepID=UPI003FA57454
MFLNGGVGPIVPLDEDRHCSCSSARAAAEIDPTQLHSTKVVVQVWTDDARTDRVDVDALLIRPDGRVAWALPIGRDLDVISQVVALGTWFGHLPERRIT